MMGGGQMMFPQWHMDISWMAFPFVIWPALTVVAVGALVWLIATLSRAEDRPAG